MLKTSIIDPRDNTNLYIAHGPVDSRLPVHETYGAIHGSFKSVTNTGIETNVVTTPDGMGAIILTDLVLSCNKTNNATVVVRFTDGTETVDIYNGDASNNTINLAISFNGRWQGWQGARLELLTDTLGQVATAAVGYYKVRQSDALPYTAWDALR
jgi:hypothetical protein